MQDKLQEELDKNGFVIVDLLNSEEVHFLNQLCDKYLQHTQTDFISSSHILNKNDSDFINDELHKILDSKFKNKFPKLQLLGGTLATKIKGKSNLKAHQDWSIVDETKFNSYNLWIPLVDTNLSNGTLGVVVGSHKWQLQKRGFNIPNPYEQFTGQFIDIGFEPSIKSGQAILYNHKLIHFSRPNSTNERRNTAIVGVKDKDALLEVSFCLDNKNIETYEVTETDFYNFNAVKIKENNKLISKTDKTLSAFSSKEIIENFKNNLPEEFHYLIRKSQTFFAKLLHKFGFAK